MRYGEQRRAHRRGLRRRTPARCSACSAPTAPARRPPSRSSRVSGSAPPARSTCSARIPATAGEPWRARTGVVLQSWRDHPRWTPRRLLTQLGGYYEPYSTPEQERPWDVEDLLDIVGLTEIADRKIATLSGGQRRRLDVAMGIIGRPELLFLDEPTAGFDPQARRDFHHLVHRLADLESTTILLTTHDLDEAEKLADRVADPGRRPDRRRRQRRTGWPAGSPARPRSSGPATASGSCTRPPTPPPSSASCSPSTATTCTTSRFAGRASRTPTWRSSSSTSRAPPRPRPTTFAEVTK